SGTGPSAGRARDSRSGRSRTRFRRRARSRCPPIGAFVEVEPLPARDIDFVLWRAVAGVLVGFGLVDQLAESIESRITAEGEALIDAFGEPAEPGHGIPPGTAAAPRMQAMMMAASIHGRVALKLQKLVKRRSREVMASPLPCAPDKAGRRVKPRAPIRDIRGPRRQRGSDPRLRPGLARLR